MFYENSMKPYVNITSFQNLSNCCEKRDGENHKNTRNNQTIEFVMVF